MDRRASSYKTNLSGEAAHQSFVPAPLPPNPPIELDAEPIGLLIKANMQLAFLEGLVTWLPKVSPFVSMYVTITGLHHYFNMKPFKIGSLVTLRKEPDNDYDGEAIAVTVPFLGKVGYVANSPLTVAAGCMSAGRLYDEIPDECAAVVRFMTSSKVIVRVLPDKKLNVKVEMMLEDLSQDIWRQLKIQLESEG